MSLPHRAVSLLVALLAAGTLLGAAERAEEPAPTLRIVNARLEGGEAAVNVASYTGHGTLREKVMGNDFRRAATAAEIAEMSRLLERDLEAGSLGLSSGLEYDPHLRGATQFANEPMADFRRGGPADRPPPRAAT